MLDPRAAVSELQAADRALVNRERRGRGDWRWDTGAARRSLLGSEKLRGGRIHRRAAEQAGASRSRLGATSLGDASATRDGRLGASEWATGLGALGAAAQ
jgi:hypothetical protein